MKRPICQLVSSATPVSEAPAKRLAPARSSGERPGVNLPVAAERAAPPVNLFFFLLYAAWVRSRAERPSVSYTKVVMEVAWTGHNLQFTKTN